MSTAGNALSATTNTVNPSPSTTATAENSSTPNTTLICLPTPAETSATKKEDLSAPTPALSNATLENVRLATSKHQLRPASAVKPSELFDAAKTLVPSSAAKNARKY